MTNSEAIDALGYLIQDVNSCRSGVWAADYTRDDVRLTVKAVLAELMDREPTDDDADKVIGFSH